LDCAAVTARTLGGVAVRIHDLAASGRNASMARRLLARSPALAAAIRRDDPAATRAAIAPLLRRQLARITITRAGRLLANAGSAPALAPTRGVLGAATYTASVMTDTELVRLVHSFTGAQVEMRAGGRRVAGTLGAAPAVLPAAGTVRVRGVRYATFSFTGRSFGDGPLVTSLLVPAAGLQTCGATPRATVIATIGRLGERLLRTEAAGAQVRRTLRIVAADRGIREAVARDDPAALRAAIVRFFRTPLHIVRIRATTASGRLVNDVGGPYVLAPASAPIRARGGRVLGHLTLSIQDDAGYMKLMRRLAGTGVILRTPAGIVPGSTASARAGDYSFSATAFPSDPLKVELLVP
jgi:hypothetical protein